MCAWAALSIGLGLGIGPHGLAAQESTVPEVRQIVTFKFQPGRSGEALELYREKAVPLYEKNEAMLSFRGLREVESPEPLDLIVISTFQGMAGMDASNEALAAEARRAGTSVGAVYGAIGELSVSHHDQFVEMVESLMNGDPTSKRLVALVSFQVLPGEGDAFERFLGRYVLAWERETGVPSMTGRFLVSDGWHYLRLIGFDSLGDYHEYWSGEDATNHHAAVDRITVRRKEIIVAPVPDLSVR